MHTVTDRQDYADFLEAIPAFSGCTRHDIEAFVAHDVVKAHCAAGKTLRPQTRRDGNLYVLVTGSAMLLTGDGVVVALEAGDYFGNARGHGEQVDAAVTALEDVVVLVINPQDVTRLGHAPALRRPVLAAECGLDRSPTTWKGIRRGRRRSALARLGE